MEWVWENGATNLISVLYNIELDRPLKSIMCYN